jgi:predicted nucleic-acid-binding protein
MISVDTNIIIRLLTGDDHDQAKKAHKLFKKSEVFIPETVIFEIRMGPTLCLRFRSR